MKNHWYAVAAKPRQEVIALANLKNQAFDAFLPLLTLRKRRQGKWQEVVEPMFPGYLFVCTDPADQSVAPIRSTIGVVGLVRFGGRLVPLPDAIIEPLRALSVEPAAFAPTFAKGDKVVFEDGPLKGLDAVFSMQKGEDRAAVLLTLMGRVSELTVELDKLSKA